MNILVALTKGLPIGTNLALLQFIWMLVSGALLPQRGAIFIALKAIGLSDQPSVLRLAGSILIEIDDEWQATDRRYFSLETMCELTHPEVLLEDLGPLRLAPIH